MMKRSMIAAAALAMFVGCTQSMDQLGGKDSAVLSDGDNEFFKTITVANETEIRSSQLALTLSQTAAVKDFAQKMISDHRMAEDKVTAVARDKGVVLPTQIDEGHQKLIDDLRGKSGTDFDKAYTDLQVTAHKETITADENEANNGKDPDVKALANDLLPTLRMHLQMAQQMKSGM